MLDILTIATLNFAVWKAAGLFSARLALSDAEILLQSPEIDQARSDRKLVVKPVRLARDSTQQRYEDVPSVESVCRTFVSKSLTWKADPNASCPFASGVCIRGDPAASEMDTGFLDSHVHLD